VIASPLTSSSFRFASLAICSRVLVLFLFCPGWTSAASYPVCPFEEWEPKEVAAVVCMAEVVRSVEIVEPDESLYAGLWLLEIEGSR